MAYNSKYTGAQVEEKLDAVDGKFDKGNIEQSTGDATDKIMSQKAVTDAIASSGGTQPTLHDDLSRIINSTTEDLDANGVPTEQLLGEVYQNLNEAISSSSTQYTAGEGITIEGGVISCNFTPTKYYTGSTTPTNETGNNGDLYLQIN